MHTGGKLCKKDVENLKGWTYKGGDDDMLARLTTQGKKDLASLAIRLKTNLDSLLNVNANSKDNFLVRWEMTVELVVKYAV